MAVQRVASEARHRFAKTNSKRIAFYANRLFTPVTIFLGLVSILFLWWAEDLRRR